MLKVGGRTGNADIDNNKKHPILLPKKHPVTELIIKEYHLRTLHAGVNTTLYAIRSKFGLSTAKQGIEKSYFHV